MSKEKLIPDETKFAAAKGFLRTTLQGYEGVLAAGITVNVVLGLLSGEFSTQTIVATTVVAILAPPIAGLRSWMSITSKGIPEAYAEAARAEAAQDS